MRPFKLPISLTIVILPFLGMLLRLQPAQAQSITADETSTQTVVTVDDNHYDISGGSLSSNGANLFHSFEQFGLSQGEVANFLSNPAVQNILGRVVGGDPSVINGLLQVSGSNANLYLMNPAGVVFGPEASLNVPADFMVTTANGLALGDGWFNAVGENDYGSLLGSPEALLFSTEQPGSIVNAGNLSVGEGHNLSLLGGTVVNTGTLSAESGNVTVAAVPGQRRVRMSHPDMLLSLELPSAETGTNGLASSRSLSELLTGGEVSVATGVEVDGSGRTWLRNTAVNAGDVATSGTIAGEQVQLAAANQVTVGGNSEQLITTHNGEHSAPIVTRFSADGTNATELVFLDTTVQDYTRLLFGATNGTTTVAIPTSENGIARVTEILGQVDAVDAVHIVSEGNEGEFWLGNAYVSNETLEQYKAQLQQWGGLLSSEADILIYACLTARGADGLALLNDIAELTGADVAGSIDLTGSEALAGDWVLERTVGTIEAGRAFDTLTLAEYDGVLQVFTATDAASLIAAINTANGNAVTDTINLANNITLTAVDNTIDGPNGLPSVTAAETLTINGMGNTLSRSATAPNFRLLRVALGADLEINETTLSGGRADTGSVVVLQPADSGGAIFNRGTVTVNNSTISGNSALNDGGAIYSTASTANSAAVNINRSTISGNSTGDNGGGIANSVFSGAGPLPNASVVTITDSTISGNSANDGGGLSNFGQNGGNGSVMNIRNSTISGNTARFTGGAIYSRGQAIQSASTVTLTNSTVTQNEVTNAGGRGGGIFSTGFFAANASRVIVENSIIAQNTAAIETDVHRDTPAGNAPVVDQGNNLIGVDSQGL